MPAEIRGLSQHKLWVAIEKAPLPGIVVPESRFSPAKHLDFQERLCAKCGLTATSASRLETEYRRYLYLKALDGGTLTPSKRVDQAWHLHIETPGGAWQRFSGEVLGGGVEHKTGLTQAEAKAGYVRTRELYCREFNDDPPPAIWPGAREKRRIFAGRMIQGGGIAFTLGAIWVILLLFLGERWTIAAIMAATLGGGIIFGYGGSVVAGTDLEIEIPNCGG